MTDKKFIRSDKTFYLDERGFLYFKINNHKKCKNFKAEQLKVYLDFATAIAKENPMPLLIDIRHVTGILSSSTFSLIAKDAKLKTSFTKIVFIASSLSIKLMILNYIRIYNPLVPSSVFNTIEHGIDHILYKPKNIVWK